MTTNSETPIKIYLPKIQFNHSETKSPSSLHYLYGFTKSSFKNLTEVYIKEITLDQKQINSSNNLLGSLTFNDIKPIKNSHVTHLLFELKVKKNSFNLLNGKNFDNREVLIIFYDGSLFSPSQLIRSKKEQPIAERTEQ